MKRIIRIVALLMAALIAVTSCQAPDSGSQLTDGTVDVSFAGPSARTITTDDGLVQTIATSDLYFQYKAVWQGEDPIPSTAKPEWTSLPGPGLSSTVKLHRGRWNLSLRAFVNQSDVNSDDKFILSGTKEGVEIGTNNMVTQTVSISLGYVRQEGNGTLHISATYPVVYHEAANSGDSPVEAVRKVKVTANVLGTDYTGEITAFDSNNVGSLDLTVPAGAAHVTVQYYMDENTLFEDDQTAKDVLIMATMTTNLAVSVDRDITAVTFKAEQPEGSVEDNVIPKVFNSLFDIYPDNIADNAIVIGYAEETKALDQTPITYPYEVFTKAEKDAQGRYTASSLGLKPIVVTSRSALNSSAATEAWYGKNISYYFSGYAPTNTTLEKVRFVDGVTSIGNYSFYDCSGLTSVTIPDSVTSIGEEAFRNCSSLASIAIPDGVTSIGTSIFENCSSLASITIPDGVTYIGRFAFYDCAGLTSITIPDSVTSIDFKAFYGCSSLTSITIPGSVITLGTSVFEGCENLTDVVIGNGVKELGDSLFYGCTKITNLTLPNTITKIGELAFYKTKITNLNIPISVTTLSKKWGRELPPSATVTYEGTIEQWYNLFGGAPSYWTGSDQDVYTDVKCSDGKIVLVIEPNEAGNGKLVKTTPHGRTLDTITVPSGHEIIEKQEGETGNHYSLFLNCNKLVTVNLPEDIERITNHMFSGCSSLENITIPNSVTSIGNSAFYGCRKLTTINIPEGVTSIGRKAFEYALISEVNLPSTITFIGSNAFESYKRETGSSSYSTSPYDLVTFNGTVDKWMNIQECNESSTKATDSYTGSGVGPINDVQCTDGKPVFITNKSTSSIIGIRPYGKTLTTLEVPENYTSISFLYDSSYNPPSVTTLILHSSMETLSDNVFKYCTNLTDVYINKAEDSIDFSNTGLPEGCMIHWNSTGLEATESV